MATYTSRNRKHLQRDLRKGKTSGGTEATMEAYGNKRHQSVKDNIRNGKAS